MHQTRSDTAPRNLARTRAAIAHAALILFITLGHLGSGIARAESEAAKRPEPPNVVILLADDLGWADVGYRGSDIETPSIDRLAEEGVVLDRFYATPICSPTRAALMTGRDPLKLGLAYDQIHPWYNAGLSPDAYTIAEAFHEAGYQTGLVGKWHLGHTQAHQLPGAQGFDHFHGHLHTNTDYFRHERESGHDLQENGKPVDLTGQYLTHIQAREAVRFIEDRNPKKPFFLYVPFTAPHSPMQAPEATIAHYAHLPRANFRREYAAMVHEMDIAIGTILDALEEQGVANDTLVLFFSDNGGFTGFGGTNTPLRGQKGQTFEGGIRVPAVLRFPGRIEGGGHYEELVSVMDVFPTVASAAGLTTRKNAAMDGLDMWPSLERGEQPPDRGPVFFVSEIPIPGLIHLGVIDGRFKLVQIVREGQTETRVKTLLFDLEEDPTEQNDLAAEQPETVAKLAALIRSWRSQHPMAGVRGTLVAHPGWVAPHDWAEAVTPARLLQPRWKNELPLMDATAERGVLVDAATRRELEQQEKAREASQQP